MARVNVATTSETETVIKKIIPYLTRRGYDVEKDFTFEYPASGSARAILGFIDILVRHSGKIAFLVEGKRIAKTLSQKDRDQAVSYGKDVKAPFVVLTNGSQFESYNPQTGKRIRWNGKLSDKVPSKKELPDALKALRKDPTLTEVPLAKDTSLPFRPACRSSSSTRSLPVATTRSEKSSATRITRSLTLQSCSF